MTPGIIPMSGDELLHHLIVDKLAKLGIVAGAVIVILIGMIIIWRRSAPKSVNRSQRDARLPDRTDRR